MAFNTGNPIGSTDPRDFSDNSENLDQAVNDSTSPTWVDRFGNTRTTLAGQIGYIGTGVDGAIESYTAGLVLTTYSTIILYSGEFYRPSASATLPYTTTATLPDVDSNLVAVGDAVLRQDLSSNASLSGSDLVAHTGTSDTVTEALNRRVIRVSSIAEIESFSLPAGYQFSLEAGESSGHFDVLSGDFSSELAADTQNGVYVGLSDDPTALTKVAKRRITDGVIRGSFYGQGSTKTSAENAAIIAEMCSYARANEDIDTIKLASGSWDADRFEIDVDRRGFHVTGAGKDLTNITSKSTTESMVVIRIDPRNRALDSQHDYPTIDGFTINGDIDSRGAAAAKRCVVVPNYAKIGFKSVGHITSNMDINGLVCDYSGHTEGRANGGTVTTNSLRFHNNAIQSSSTAYTSASGGGTTNAIVMDDLATTLASPASATDTVITLASGHGIETYQRIEIGDVVADVLYVTNVSGDDITLDSPLASSYSAGEAVKLPMIGNHYVGTIELGDAVINNVLNCSITSTYTEDCRFRLTGYLRGFKISGINCSEEVPSIEIIDLDERSQVAIRDNFTSFKIEITCTGRQGVVDDRIDIRSLPDLYIENMTRGLDKIRINNTYSFSSLKVQKDFNTSFGDFMGTLFEFEGLFASVPATTTQSIIKFYLEGTGTLLDGVTFDTFTSTRRPTGSSDRQVGVFSRQGIASTNGTNTTVNTNDIVTDYLYSIDSTGAVDVNYAVAVNEASIDVAGEAGSLDTWTFTRGKVYSLKER